ncbi:DUF663-domain-containing protein [Suhomyces tanzawaensis NRRL Y-17324]|uniref:DUF663-domain-containing protein n=1 Tax=Suhomyces tanzawaensis NRRL Y-17324 TaxID=984487 RepID=A0A1E4SLB8_9ASCO|nr:DUF663-domain-containing protein [Suhomyces tanzawaensis NRRL Y-17324]ODV80294.1 DUF663-domain-containing protein [Suhomyces tanzawaensis NRRL Y-17324]
MAKGGHSHRSTLKNDHKPFKSKHASKGQLKNQHKGKVEKSAAGGSKSKVLSKIERKNLSKQLKENKILESKMTRKLFEGSQGAEKIVTVIALTNDIDAAQIAQKLLEQELTHPLATPSVTNVKVTKFKSNLKVIIPDHNDMLAILDAAKVADYVVFGISATEEVDKAFGEQVLRALTAQGIASVIGVLPNVVSAYPKRNLQMDIRQSLQSFFNHFFPNEDKLYALEADSENSNCLRTICQKFPKSIKWRDARGYMVADNAYWSGNEDGTVVLEGTVRGIGFNANRLVHVPGFGDFQIEKIEKLPKGRANMDIDTEFYVPDENQETLEELNPEEIEMDDDMDFYNEDNDLGVRMDGRTYFDDDGVKRSEHKKLPKGTSEYQGRWFINDVLEDASDLESDEEPMIEEVDMEEDMVPAEPTGTEYAPTEFTEMHVELTPEEEERQLAEYRQLEKDDLEFPDEIELNPSESGKERLAAFRGIKSLYNCDWDYDEHDVESPSIWKRLLRISNYKATKNRVTKEAIKEVQVNIGEKARIFIKAPAFMLEKFNCNVQPLTIYELFQYEHKLAVCNFSFQSWEDYEAPVPSKESLVVQYGPRRQVIQPAFNQASNNSNNVHKYESFVHQGNTSIATAIAPVLFNSAPVIYFKPAQEGGIEFVGQGTFLNCDHTRVVAQRAVLTGHAIKIHKRVVTVRYMFFNAEDINWFKAIPLFTKSGRSGFIKESLGTHGYFKAQFDGKLSSQDVIAMSMYKRVWPDVSAAFE